MIYITFGCLDVLLGRKNNLFILCYHSLGSDGWEHSISLSEFEKQMKYLVEIYKPVKMSDIYKVLGGKKKLNSPSFVISFDDGYKDIMHARDIVKELGIKPCLFLISDTKSANRKVLNTNRAFLNKSDIELLIEDGWEIGSHSATHNFLSTLNSKLLENEVVNSKSSLEKLYGVKVHYFSYPMGNYSVAIESLVKNAGYKMAVTMDSGMINERYKEFRLPREGVDATHNFMEFKYLFSPSVVNIKKAIKKLSNKI